MMHRIRPLFVAILAVALGAYAFDCEAATTPEQDAVLQVDALLSVRPSWSGLL